MEVRAKKALGQHFLTDQSIAKNIVEALEGHQALEVGPGSLGLVGSEMCIRDSSDR